MKQKSMLLLRIPYAPDRGRVTSPSPPCLLYSDSHVTRSPPVFREDNRKWRLCLSREGPCHGLLQVQSHWLSREMRPPPAGAPDRSRPACGEPDCAQPPPRVWATCVPLSTDPGP